MQKGQVRLELGQSGSVCLHPLEIFEFGGDMLVHCYGSGTDLNLMLKNGARGTLTCVKAGPGEMISIPAGSGMLLAQNTEQEAFNYIQQMMG